MTAPLRQRLLDILNKMEDDDLSPKETLPLIVEALASDEGAVEAVYQVIRKSPGDRTTVRAALAALARHVREG